MKRIFIVPLLFSFAGLFGQNSVKPVSKNLQENVQDRWDLDRYLWSHTNHLSSRKSKPILDYKAIDNWVSLPPLTVPAISRNGQYIAYTYGYNQSVTGKPLFDTLVLLSTTGVWRQTFTGAGSGFFSMDNKQYIFKNKEGLNFIDLGSDQHRLVKGVVGYKIPYSGKSTDKNEWIAYQLPDKELVLQNLLTGKEKRFSAVGDYKFDNTGNWLACQLNNEAKELIVYNVNADTAFRYLSVDGYTFSSGGNALLLKSVDSSSTINLRLEYANLEDGKAIPIWQASKNSMVKNFQLDGAGRQVVFVVQSLNAEQDGKKQLSENSIWYWKKGSGKAVMMLSDRSAEIGDKLIILGDASFANNNKYIQFFLSPQIEQQSADPDASKVDIWNYKDSVLLSTQVANLTKPIQFRTVIDVESGKVVQLEKENERLMVMGVSIVGDYALIEKQPDNDRFWERKYGDKSFVVVSLKNGNRSLLTDKGSIIRFSPNGHYVVYFTRDQGGCYYSYNLQTGKIVNICASAKAGQFAYKDPYLRSKKMPANIFVLSLMIGWVSESGILVSDNYDLWLLDLDGVKSPVNLTNGYGRLHQTVFQVSGRKSAFVMGVYRANDTLLLNAFNRQNKYNGYYRKIIGSTGNPQKLYLGPCFMENMEGIGGSANGMGPIKAADANIWIVQRQTATEAPNYFLTPDFKRFIPITDLQPQMPYNWYTTELHRFKQLDGSLGQGILYKPENFDATKKYPVIVSFYESRLSNQLYQFVAPAYISCPSIFTEPAWMVSHGYLVFVPDVYFIQGNWGESIMNSIDGTARYLKTLPYVNGKCIGLVGHSNSGRYGYYLLTHSHSFAAMAIGSGWGGTDVLSVALSGNKPLNVNSTDLEWIERTTAGEGLGMLWANKAKWLDHTAVLNADKATSPLLLFHCKNDGDDVRLAVELYIALRRVEKKAWWLQYDEGLHTLEKLRDLRDFTLRYTQYFDHYLKGGPAPRWMTKGIGASMKGLETGYELDPRGSCAMKGKDECPICKKWNEQYRKNPEMLSQVSGQ